MKPLLLGEAPSRTGDRFWRFPLSGRPAEVLCRAAGIPPREDSSRYGRWTWALYDEFECENVYDRYADATPWCAPDARYEARRKMLASDAGTVVCLGRKVQDAVGLDGDFYEWGTVRAETSDRLWLVVAVPHPSGLNRLLNDPAERERMGAALMVARAAPAAIESFA